MEHIKEMSFQETTQRIHVHCINQWTVVYSSSLLHLTDSPTHSSSGLSTRHPVCFQVALTQGYQLEVECYRHHRRQDRVRMSLVPPPAVEWMPLEVQLCQSAVEQRQKAGGPRLTIHYGCPQMPPYSLHVINHKRAVKFLALIISSSTTRLL